jgi:hypothetical protein
MEGDLRPKGNAIFSEDHTDEPPWTFPSAAILALSEGFGTAGDGNVAFLKGENREAPARQKNMELRNGNMDAATTGNARTFLR